RQLLAELEAELRAGDGAAGTSPAGASIAAHPTPPPASGAARIAELREHPAYRDGRHAEHRAVVAELGDLLSHE
ncbi:MAG: hypothetical protein ACREFQ_17040, partial [Stellaceae bacterium]